jgi:hypothetical protein
MQTASKNKLTRRDKESVQRIKSRLQERLGRDEAEKQAHNIVARRAGGKGGGANAAGEAQKQRRRPSRRKRTGSDSNASK